MLRAGIAQIRKVYPFEKSLTRAEQDRCDRNMHFVDHTLAKALLDDFDAAANANILALGHLACLSQGGINFINSQFAAIVSEKILLKRAGRDGPAMK